MDTIKNATLYLTRYPSNLAKILPQGKSDRGLLRRATYVEFVIAGQAIRFNIMRKAGMQKHLADFAGYMKQLRDRGVNTEAEIRSATAILPGITCVLGGVFSRPFEFNSEVTEMLFSFAHHYNGYVFMLDSLFTPGMTTVCGPAVIERG